MAVCRPIPKCIHCGNPIAKAIYKDESDTPIMMRLYGDTFIRWEFFECDCKESVREKLIMELEHKKALENLANMPLLSDIFKNGKNRIIPSVPKNERIQINEGTDPKIDNNRMSNDDRLYIQSSIKNEGFDYTFTQYSDFDDIEDYEFHKLINLYVEAKRKLENYIFNN